MFREDLAPVDLQMVISAFCAFRVDHRYTFSKLFGRDLMDAQLRLHHKELLVDTLMRLLTKLNRAATQVALITRRLPPNPIDLAG